jgi:2-dehydro-3-deoxygluconokinase
MVEAVTCGEALALMQPRDRGPLDTVRDFQLRVAGAELNVAVGLARLGIRTAFYGAVGDDPFGRLIAKTLAGESVATEGLVRLPQPTGLFFKEWHGLDWEPAVYYYRRNSAGSHWQYTGGIGWEGVRWVHTSGITLMIGEAAQASAVRLLQEGAAAGAAVSLDVNLRFKLGPPPAWREALARVLPLCRVVLATADEAAHVWGAAAPEELYDRGILSPEQVLVVKRGPAGSEAFAAGLHWTAPARPAAVTVDPVGAGDGFAAGLIAARLRGRDWPAALRLGNVVGAFAVAHPGDYEGYPTWEMAEAADEKTDRLR